MNKIYIDQNFISNKSKVYFLKNFIYLLILANIKITQLKLYILDGNSQMSLSLIYLFFFILNKSVLIYDDDYASKQDMTLN